MITAVNLFTAEHAGGRLDVACAAESSETAMYLYDIAPWSHGEEVWDTAQ